MQDYKCHQIQNVQHTQSQPFYVPDRYLEQMRLCREWEEEMARLNGKYGLDCSSASELDSESDKGEDYRYEHKYETLMWIIEICGIKILHIGVKMQYAVYILSFNSIRLYIRIWNNCTTLWEKSHHLNNFSLQFNSKFHIEIIPYFEIES